MRSLVTKSAFIFVFAIAGCEQSNVTATQNSGQVVSDCGLPTAQMGQFATIPAGSFLAGADARYPEEGPSQSVTVAAFELQIHEVTNDQFAAFVAATGYRTDAETSADSGREDGGSGVFVRPTPANGVGQWALEKSASWRSPLGKGDDLAGKGDWPVVHVSKRDATAYARWVKARLPTEMEWEYAAHLGLPDPQDSRSGAYDQSGKPRANTWQGFFPAHDEGTDGFEGAAPVGCFAADRNGLSDMIGNVWEWTASNAPAAGQSIIKGGSHLCTDTFCSRYRPQARQFQDIDFSTNHIGFRVARDVTR